MTLTLRAVSLNDQALSQPITAHFDHQGGTIGRADHNTLALPDPERHISRQQAQILRGEGQYRIRNVGSANPIVVGSVSLGQGEGCALAHGDQVRIGGYLLEVIDDQAGQLGGATITRGRAAVDAVAPRRTGPGTAVAPDDPLAPRSGPGLPLSAPLSSDNPFADLLGPAGAGAPAAAPLDDPFAGLGAPAGLRADSPAWAAPPAPLARLPDDFDPFAAPAPAAPRAPAPSAADDPFADLLGTAAPPSSLDALFGLPGGAPAVDPLADFLARPLPPSATPRSADGAAGSAASAASAAADPPAMSSPAPSPARAAAPAGEAVPGALSLDPLAAFGAAPAPAGPAPQGLAREADRPALDAAWRPPVPVATPAPSPAMSPAPTPTAGPVPTPPAARAPRRAAPGEDGPSTMPSFRPATAPPPVAPDPPAARHDGRPVGGAPSTPAGAEADALWAAFCEGAGLSLRPPQGLNPDLMRVMGEVMRAAVEGTLLLMAARSATKLELRAQVTVIQGRNNNPLKFSPDAGAALEQLLQPPQRGFLPGPAAMREAMDDLGAHTLATMSGTRAALEGVLARFAPGQLEAKLAGRSVMDSLLPMNRRARLWELYLQHHQAIHEEAQEDFHQLFGRAFLAAYEQQIDRFERERAASRPAGR